MKFSKVSAARLATCHPDLQRLFNDVIKHWDCSVTYGIRTEEEQTQMVAKGKSKTINSKHLRQADGYSHAVDVVPYPVDWKDHRRFYYFGGFVLGTAKKLGIPIRWGGDWNGNLEVKDQNFNDLPHFELLT